jgi:hypothetical protein
MQNRGAVGFRSTSSCLIWEESANVLGVPENNRLLSLGTLWQEHELSFGNQKRSE